MKIRLLIAWLVLGALAPIFLAAADAPKAVEVPTAEFSVLVARIKDKLQAGKNTAADLKEELAAFDALLAKVRGQKTDEVAEMFFMRATLYAQVLHDTDKARQYLTELKGDFANTTAGKAADEFIATLDRQVQAEHAKDNLVGHPAPELHFKWSNREGLTKLSDLRGKVVVLDFWATWCGPCVASFPNVRELAAEYRGADVVILGVTSLQGYVMGLEPQRIDTKGDPAKELALMKDYVKAKDITWSIAVSDEEVFNPDYGVTGIPNMVIIAPDGTVRYAGLHPAMPHAEKVEKLNAVLKEFGKTVPATSGTN